MNKIELSDFKRRALVSMPVVLIVSTFLLFRFLVTNFSLETAFAGYFFYWGFWGVCFPLWLFGKSGLVALFKGSTATKSKPTCEDWILLAIPPGIYVLIAVVTIFLPGLVPDMAIPTINLPDSHLLLLVIGILMVLINGVLEEVIWRGAYVLAFPKEAILGYIYPAIAFSLWHLSPMIGLFNMRGAGDIIEIIVLGVVLGLCWGRVAWRRGSIKWPVVSHIFANVGHVGLFLYLIAG